MKAITPKKEVIMAFVSKEEYDAKIAELETMINKLEQRLNELLRK